MNATDSHYGDDLTEANLAAVMDRRANRVAVRQDLDLLLERAANNDAGGGDPVRTGLTQPARTLLAVASVIVFGMVGVFAVSRLAEDIGQSADTEDTAEINIANAASEAASGATDEEQIGPTLVWLDVGASEAEVAEVARWLDQNPAVERHHYLDAEETYAEFREYFADEPEILELVAPHQLPTSFRVFTSDPTALEDAKQFSSVQEVELPLGQRPAIVHDGPPGTIIWLEVPVSDTEVAEVARWLDENPLVDDYRYVDRDETYAEFREYFADEPEVIDLVEPDQLPTSFNVTTEDPVALARAVERLAGVDDVEINGGRETDTGAEE